VARWRSHSGRTSGVRSSTSSSRAAPAQARKSSCVSAQDVVEAEDPERRVPARTPRAMQDDTANESHHKESRSSKAARLAFHALGGQDVRDGFDYIFLRRKREVQPFIVVVDANDGRFAGVYGHASYFGFGPRPDDLYLECVCAFIVRLGDHARTTSPIEKGPLYRALSCMGGSGLEPVTPSLSRRPRHSRAFAVASSFSLLCRDFNPPHTCRIRARLRPLLWARGSTVAASTTRLRWGDEPPGQPLASLTRSCLVTRAR
jgi:hypothetical protein